jgi:hypothetical protein
VNLRYVYKVCLTASETSCVFSHTLKNSRTCLQCTRRPFVFRDAAADSGGQASNFCSTSRTFRPYFSVKCDKTIFVSRETGELHRRSAVHLLKKIPLRYGTQIFLTPTLEGTWRNIWLVPSSCFAKNTAFRQMISLPSSYSMRTADPNLLRIHWMQLVADGDIQACQTQLLKPNMKLYNRYSYFILALQT